LAPVRTRPPVNGPLGELERTRRVVRFARVLHRRVRAFGPAFGGSLSLT
jgi:hypothetical protein